MKESRTKHILLVEDNAGIADALGLVLEGEGYRVELWASAGAMYPLQEPLPDLILLDVLLSGMDGRTICRQLKEQATTRHIAIILMSATKSLPQIAEEAGADDWLSKPFKMQTLLAFVETYVGSGAL